MRGRLTALERLQKRLEISGSSVFDGLPLHFAAVTVVNEFDPGI